MKHECSQGSVYKYVVEHSVYNVYMLVRCLLLIFTLHHSPHCISNFLRRCTAIELFTEWSWNALIHIRLFGRCTSLGRHISRRRATKMLWVPSRRFDLISSAWSSARIGSVLSLNEVQSLEILKLWLQLHFILKSHISKDFSLGHYSSVVNFPPNHQR